MRQTAEVNDTDIPLAPFHLADIRPIKLGFECQPLLGDMQAFSQRTHILTQFRQHQAPCIHVVYYRCLMYASLRTPSHIREVGRNEI